MRWHKVWKLVKMNAVPKHKHLVGHKWAFKTKRNGTHHARLVALGCTQISGVDHTENFAPVVDDVTVHLALLAAPHANTEGGVD